jgi:hypothetical protein
MENQRTQAEIKHQSEDDAPSGSADIFSFLKTLLYTLSAVLTGNSSNQAYFRNDIHFSTLSGIRVEKAIEPFQIHFNPATSLRDKKQSNYVTHC